MNQQPRDVIEVLEQQHADVRDLMASLRESPDRQLFTQLVQLLSAHETAEETVVYPVVRSTVPDGDALADARLEEERSAKERLADLEAMGVADESFPATFGLFADDVLRHATNEERHVFPLIREHVSEQKRTNMAKALRVVEAIGPTHAHRRAPTSAIGNLIVGPIVGVIDRIRDAIAGRRAS